MTYTDFEKAYLDSQIEYLERISNLIEDEKNLDMAFILLCCFIDDFAALKYHSVDGMGRGSHLDN